MSGTGKFIDKYLLSIAVTLGVIAFTYDFYSHSDTFTLTKAAVALVALAATRERTKSQKEINAARKQKGLTSEDIDNIAFVKKWEQIQQSGLRTYCIKDGGIITGAAIALVFGILVMFSNFAAVSDSPSSMFSFIGYCYLAGIIAGTAFYRFLWYLNQKKFKELTDPFYKTLLPKPDVDNQA